MSFCTEDRVLDLNQVPANYGLLLVSVDEELLGYRHAVYICDHVGSTVAELVGAREVTPSENPKYCLSICLPCQLLSCRPSV